jgi:hypothetical protein
MPPRAPPPPPDVFFTISTRVCALGGHVVRAESAPGSFALRFILDHWLSGAMLHVELRGAALRITKVDEFGSTEPAKTSDVDAATRPQIVILARASVSRRSLSSEPLDFSKRILHAAFHPHQARRRRQRVPRSTPDPRVTRRLRRAQNIIAVAATSTLYIFRV